MKDWTGNSNSIYKILGASNHTDKEREQNDYYATDPYAIDKLLMVEKPNKNIWECAAGEGHLSKRLKDYGYDVVTSDIIERNYKLDFVQDFLTIDKEDNQVDLVFKDYDILTNPPFKYATSFILKALDLIKPGNKAYMFLKIQFLEGKQRYRDLFSKYPPKKIYVFSERVMCAKNGDFEGMKAGGGSAVCYAWYVFEKDYKGKAEVQWI